MNMGDFETQLEAMIGRPSNSRPFVCNGSPLECSVFIVGINAATEVGDFWEHWKSGWGFDKAAWFKAYKLRRAAQPLKEGRTRRQAISATRRNIEVLVDSLHPFKVLETNLFSKATATAAELGQGDRTVEIVRFLCDAVKPRLIFTHGVEASAEVRSLGTTSTLICDDHLSRGWSRTRIEALGTSIRTRLEVS